MQSRGAGVRVYTAALPAHPATFTVSGTLNVNPLSGEEVLFTSDANTLKGKNLEWT